MGKLTVIYDPHDEQAPMVTDADAESYVGCSIEDTSDDNHVTVKTCQESVVNWVRVFISRGAISHTDVEFKFQDRVIYPDKFGSLDHWPTGFCDYNDKILQELLMNTFFANDGVNNG